MTQLYLPAEAGTAPRCETVGCYHAAVATVHGQCSVVDFMSFECCHGHIQDVAYWMRALRVDQLAIAELWIHYYGGPLLVEL